jgi:hypothetical protein
MAAAPETYLAILKASYDYEPQPDAEDELAIKEDQLLFLLEKTDDEYVLFVTALAPRRLTSSPLTAGGKSRSS